MKVTVRPTGAPTNIGITLGFGPNGSPASLDTAPIEPALVAGDLVLMQRGGALVKIAATALADGVVAGAGDVSADTVMVAAGRPARSLASRALDVVNVLDFGADPTGATDSAPAFDTAISYVASGQAVRLFVPRGSYRLNSVVGTAGRTVAVAFDDGADIQSGSAGYLGVNRVEAKQGAFRVLQTNGGYFGIGAGSASFTSFDTENVTNNTGLNGTAWNRLYQNTNLYGATGGSQDQVEQRIVSALTLFDSSQWMEFSVLNGPIFDEYSQSLGYQGSLQYGEWDVVNNTPETGWTDQDSIGTAAAGLAIDPAGGNSPYLGGHIRWPFGTAGSVTGGGGTPNNRWWTYPAAFSGVNPTAQAGTLTITATDGAGTVQGPVNVTVGGAGALSDWVTAINAAGIAGIAAAVSTWGGSLSRLVIYSTVANGLGTITLSGGALGHLGLAAGTYFTHRAQDIVVFGGTNISGAGGATFTLNGHSITVGGAGAGADVAAAINAAALTGIQAAVTARGQLVVSAWCGSQQLAAPYWSGQVYPTLAIAGGGAATVGLPTGGFYAPGPPEAFATAWSETYPLTVPAGCTISINGTDVAVSGSTTAIASAINGAGIANVQAFVRGGNRLGIRNTAGGTLALQDVVGNALDLLGIMGGGLLATFQPGGYSAGSYNGFFIAPDAIAPSGRGIYIGGSSYSDVSVWPHTPAEARGSFQHGLRLDRATFGDGVGLRLGSGQAIAFGAPGTAQVLTAAGDTLVLAANGQAQGLALGQLFGTSAAGTAVRLTADGAAAAAANSWPIATGHALFGDIRVLAVNPATTDIACWSVPLAAHNGGTLAVVNPGTGALAPTYGTGTMLSATLTVTADTTHGAIDVVVTPPSGVVARCQASFIGATD